MDFRLDVRRYYCRDIRPPSRHLTQHPRGQVGCSQNSSFGVVVSLTSSVPKTIGESIALDPVRIQKRPVILLVEDHDDLRGMFRIALTVAGFQVHEAADGYDALRLLDEENPILVVLDLRLPLVDGREVL